MDEDLIEALGTSQRLGFLGDWPISEVIAHSRRFVHAIDVHRTPVPGGWDLRIADIGSGGGVPGLVVAHDLPETHVTLLDRREARTDHLRRLTRRLGWADRVVVRCVDLDATPSDLLGAFDVVTARGFGPPVATLAAAVPLLRPAGLVVVSEPPTPVAGRWIPSSLAQFGLERADQADTLTAVFRRI